MLCDFAMLIFLMIIGFQLKMRAGGMSESSKWKKQKRSPRPPRHVTKVSPGTEQPAANAGNTTGKLKSGSRDQTASALELFLESVFISFLFTCWFALDFFLLVLSDYSHYRVL